METSIALVGDERVAVSEQQLNKMSLRKIKKQFWYGRLKLVELNRFPCKLLDWRKDRADKNWIDARGNTYMGDAAGEIDEYKIITHGIHSMTSQRINQNLPNEYWITLPNV